MRIGMRHFEAETVDWLREQTGRGVSRSALARGICEMEGWVNDAGEPCTSSARTVLPKLAAGFGIALPPPVRTVPTGAASAPDFPDVSFEGGLSGLGAVTLEPVQASDRGSFRAMMDARHPRGAPAHPGRKLAFWLCSERLGRIGGLTFHAAGWHVKARDAFVGWSPRARIANLPLLVNNSRFLVLPGVRARNLASHVLALAADRLADDWETVHGVRPAALYTFVGPDRAGTCYAAAGWTRVGESSGSPPGACGRNSRCGIWMLPLEDGWRERTCTEPPVTAGTSCRALPEDASWADLEFGFARHHDGRVNKRILAMGRAWETRPGQPVSVAFSETKDRKAAYRLLSNPTVTMDHVLESHLAATRDRCLGHDVVLAIEDTTMLDFTGLADVADGLAPLGGGGSGSVGIPTHATLAISGSGRALGLLRIDADFRKPEGPSESRRWRDSMETARELGRANPGTRVISVADREGDTWEMFACQAAEPETAGLLVRACASKRRKAMTDGGSVDLRERVTGLDPVGRRTVDVPARGRTPASKGRRAVKARTARTAEIELRVARVDLKEPGSGTATLPVTAVLASETSTPPKGTEPISWLLLSSEGGADLENAIATLENYRARWRIEEWFKALKQFTRIEDRRFDDADDLRKCLAFDAVLAWRAFDLHKAARAEPERPALDFFHVDELAILCLEMARLGFKNVRAPPFDDLAVREAVVDLARYAGFIPSKRQPLPGIMKIRTAMKFLLPATAVYRGLKPYLKLPVSTVS